MLIDHAVIIFDDPSSSVILLTADLFYAFYGAILAK